ncbi:hypothetical protein LI90_3532 [Carbonactinospora thermoautotrophica]|uniref:Uncharacterized protein n=1 Tax=Carbonactinospora thermoautotrophica TaxID=1469144 RepID=A0A132MXA9_9ACTN|nr:hypothetical protein LI90_3532 [Carbonactinospora thermoautotrophica]
MEGVTPLRRVGVGNDTSGQRTARRAPARRRDDFARRILSRRTI